MTISTALALQPVGLDSWISAVLLIGALTLVGLNCFGSRRIPRARTDDPTDSAPYDNGGLGAEAKSRNSRPGHQNSDTPPTSQCCLRACPERNKGPGWTVEKIMRVSSSIVILLAAIYIIIFDQEANTDRQKWAFGAVGLVFGHWAKR